MVPYLRQPVSEPLCNVILVSLILYSWRACFNRVVEPLGVNFSFRKETFLVFLLLICLYEWYTFFFAAVYLYIWSLSFSVAVLPCVLCLTRVCLILSTVHKIAFQLIYVQFCMGTLDICAPAYTMCVNTCLNLLRSFFIFMTKCTRAVEWTLQADCVLAGLSATMSVKHC